MEEKFLEILGNIWGTDIAHQESQAQIDLIMKAMNKAYELGNKTNDIHSVMPSVYGIFKYSNNEVYSLFWKEEDAESVFASEKLDDSVWYVDEASFCEM